MIEELGEGESLELEQVGDKRTRVCSCQLPLRKDGTIRKSLAREGRKSVRFPWIHNREPVDFHSLILLPSKNHSAIRL